MLLGGPPGGGTGILLFLAESAPRGRDGGLPAAGGDGGCPATGGDEGIAPRARDGARALPVLGMHPPFSFLCLAREKRMRRARWKRKERRFWHSREPHASMEGRSADLMRGRMDFLLFPRFAPSRLRAGKRVRLPAVGGQICPNVPGQARSAGRGARDDASKQQNTLGGTCRCGRAPPQGTLSDAAGRGLAIHLGTGSGQPPYFGHNLTLAVKFVPGVLFSLWTVHGPFLFSLARQRKEKWGVHLHQPSSWLNPAPAAPAARNHSALRRWAYRSSVRPISQSTETS